MVLYHDDGFPHRSATPITAVEAYHGTVVFASNSLLERQYVLRGLLQKSRPNHSCRLNATSHSGLRLVASKENIRQQCEQLSQEILQKKSEQVTDMIYSI